MNNTYHIEGDFLVRKRGGLGDFNPNEVVRRFSELTGFHRSVGVQRKQVAFERIAGEFGVKLNTVRWAYMVAKDGYAGRYKKK